MGYEVSAAVGVKIARPNKRSMPCWGRLLLNGTHRISDLNSRGQKNQRGAVRQYGKRLYQQPANRQRYGQFRYGIPLPQWRN